MSDLSVQPGTEQLKVQDTRDDINAEAHVQIQLQATEEIKVEDESASRGSASDVSTISDNSSSFDNSGKTQTTSVIEVDAQGNYILNLTPPEPDDIGEGSGDQVSVSAEVEEIDPESYLKAVNDPVTPVYAVDSPESYLNPFAESVQSLVRELVDTGVIARGMSNDELVEKISGYLRGNFGKVDAKDLPYLSDLSSVIEAKEATGDDLNMLCAALAAAAFAELSEESFSTAVRRISCVGGEGRDGSKEFCLRYVDDSGTARIIDFNRDDGTGLTNTPDSESYINKVDFVVSVDGIEIFDEDYPRTQIIDPDSHIYIVADRNERKIGNGQQSLQQAGESVLVDQLFAGIFPDGTAGLSDEEIIQRINEYVNGNVSYISESQDSWTPPQDLAQALLNGESVSADCEEYAMLKAALLNKAGLTNSYVVVTGDGRHAYAMAERPDGNACILEQDGLYTGLTGDQVLGTSAAYFSIDEAVINKNDIEVDTAFLGSIGGAIAGAVSAVSPVASLVVEGGLNAAVGLGAAKLGVGAAKKDIKVKMDNLTQAEIDTQNAHYNQADTSYIYEITIEVPKNMKHGYEAVSSTFDEIIDTIESFDSGDFWYYDTQLCDKKGPGAAFKVFDTERANAFLQKINNLQMLMEMLDHLAEANDKRLADFTNAITGLDRDKQDDSKESGDAVDSEIEKASDVHELVKKSMDGLFTEVQEYNQKIVEELMAKIEGAADTSCFTNFVGSFTGYNPAEDVLKAQEYVLSAYESVAAKQVESAKKSLLFATMSTVEDTVEAEQEQQRHEMTVANALDRVEAETNAVLNAYASEQMYVKTGNGFYDYDTMGALEIKNRLSMLEALEKLVLLTLESLDDMQSTFSDQITGRSYGSTGNWEGINKAFGDRSTLRMSSVAKLEVLQKQHIQIHNSRRKIQLAIKKLHRAAPFRALSAILSAVAVAVAFTGFGAALSVALVALSAVANYAAAAAANSVDDRYDVKTAFDEKSAAMDEADDTQRELDKAKKQAVLGSDYQATFADRLADLNWRQNELLLSINPSNYVSREGDTYAVNSMALAQLDRELTTIQNLMRMVMEMYKSTLHSEKVFASVITGVFMRDTAGFSQLSGVLESQLNLSWMAFNALKFDLQEVAQRKTSILARKKAMRSALRNLVTQLASCALYFVPVAGPVLSAVTNMAATTYNSYMDNKNAMRADFSSDVKFTEPNAVAQLAQEGTPVSKALLELELREDQLLDQAYSQGIISAGGGFYGVNYDMMAELRAKLTDIQLIRDMVIQIQSSQKSMMDAFLQVLGTPTIYSVRMNSIGRARSQSVMRAFNLVIDHLNTQKDVMNRKVQAERAFKQAITSSAIQLGCSIVGSAIGFGEAGGFGGTPVPTENIATAFFIGSIVGQVASNFVRYAILESYTDRDFGELNKKSDDSRIDNQNKAQGEAQEAASQAERAAMERAASVATRALDYMLSAERSAVSAINTDMIVDVGGGRWGVSGEHLAVAMDKLAQIAMVRDMLIKILDKAFANQARFTKAVTGVNISGVSLDGVADTLNESSMDIATYTFRHLNEICNRQHQILQARQTATQALINAIVSLVNSLVTAYLAGKDGSLDQGYDKQKTMSDKALVVAQMTMDVLNKFANYIALRTADAGKQDKYQPVTDLKSKPKPAGKGKGGNPFAKLIAVIVYYQRETTLHKITTGQAKMKREAEKARQELNRALNEAIFETLTDPQLMKNLYHLGKDIGKAIGKAVGTGDPVPANNQPPPPPPPPPPPAKDVPANEQKKPENKDGKSEDPDKEDVSGAEPGTIPQTGKAARAASIQPVIAAETANTESAEEQKDNQTVDAQNQKTGEQQQTTQPGQTPGTAGGDPGKQPVDKNTGQPVPGADKTDPGKPVSSTPPKDVLAPDGKQAGKEPSGILKTIARGIVRQAMEQAIQKDAKAYLFNQALTLLVSNSEVFLDKLLWEAVERLTSEAQVSFSRPLQALTPAKAQEVLNVFKSSVFDAAREALFGKDLTVDSPAEALQLMEDRLQTVEQAAFFVLGKTSAAERKQLTEMLEFIASNPLAYGEKAAHNATMALAMLASDQTNNVDKAVTEIAIKALNRLSATIEDYKVMETLLSVAARNADSSIREQAFFRDIASRYRQDIEKKAAELNKSVQEYVAIQAAAAASTQQASPAVAAAMFAYSIDPKDSKMPLLILNEMAKQNVKADISIDALKALQNFNPEILQAVLSPKALTDTLKPSDIKLQSLKPQVEAVQAREVLTAALQNGAQGIILLPQQVQQFKDMLFRKEYQDIRELDPLRDLVSRMDSEGKPAAMTAADLSSAEIRQAVTALGTAAIANNDVTAQLQTANFLAAAAIAVSEKGVPAEQVQAVVKMLGEQPDEIRKQFCETLAKALISGKVSAENAAQILITLSDAGAKTEAIAIARSMLAQAPDAQKTLDVLDKVQAKTDLIGEALKSPSAEPNKEFLTMLFTRGAAADPASQSVQNLKNVVQEKLFANKGEAFDKLLPEKTLVLGHKSELGPKLEIGQNQDGTPKIDYARHPDGTTILQVDGPTMAGAIQFLADTVSPDQLASAFMNAKDTQAAQETFAELVTSSAGNAVESLAGDQKVYDLTRQTAASMADKGKGAESFFDGAVAKLNEGIKEKEDGYRENHKEDPDADYTRNYKTEVEFYEKLTGKASPKPLSTPVPVTNTEHLLDRIAGAKDISVQLEKAYRDDPAALAQAVLDAVQNGRMDAINQIMQNMPPAEVQHDRSSALLMSAVQEAALLIRSIEALAKNPASADDRKGLAKVLAAQATGVEGRSPEKAASVLTVIGSHKVLKGQEAMLTDIARQCLDTAGQGAAKGAVRALAIAAETAPEQITKAVAGYLEQNAQQYLADPSSRPAITRLAAEDPKLLVKALQSLSDPATKTQLIRQTAEQLGKVDESSLRDFATCVHEADIQVFEEVAAALEQRQDVPADVTEAFRQVKAQSRAAGLQDRMDSVTTEAGKVDTVVGELRNSPPDQQAALLTHLVRRSPENMKIAAEALHKLASEDAETAQRVMRELFAEDPAVFVQVCAYLQESSSSAQDKLQSLINAVSEPDTNRQHGQALAGMRELLQAMQHGKNNLQQLARPVADIARVQGMKAAAAATLALVGDKPETLTTILPAITRQIADTQGPAQAAAFLKEVAGQAGSLPEATVNTSLEAAGSVLGEAVKKILTQASPQRGNALSAIAEMEQVKQLASTVTDLQSTVFSTIDTLPAQEKVEALTILASGTDSTVGKEARTRLQSMATGRDAKNVRIALQRISSSGEVPQSVKDTAKVYLGVANLGELNNDKTAQEQLLQDFKDSSEYEAFTAASSVTDKLEAVNRFSAQYLDLQPDARGKDTYTPLVHLIKQADDAGNPVSRVGDCEEKALLTKALLDGLQDAGQLDIRDSKVAVTGLGDHAVVIVPTDTASVQVLDNQNGTALQAALERNIDQAVQSGGTFSEGMFKATYDTRSVFINPENPAPILTGTVSRSPAQETVSELAPGPDRADKKVLIQELVQQGLKAADASSPQDLSNSFAVQMLSGAAFDQEHLELIAGTLSQADGNQETKAMLLEAVVSRLAAARLSQAADLVSAVRGIDAALAEKAAAGAEKQTGTVLSGPAFAVATEAESLKERLARSSQPESVIREYLETSLHEQREPSSVAAVLASASHQDQATEEAVTHAVAGTVKEADEKEIEQLAFVWIELFTEDAGVAAQTGMQLEPQSSEKLVAALDRITGEVRDAKTANTSVVAEAKQLLQSMAAGKTRQLAQAVSQVALRDVRQGVAVLQATVKNNPEQLMAVSSETMNRLNQHDAAIASRFAREHTQQSGEYAILGTGTSQQSGRVIDTRALQMVSQLMELPMEEREARLMKILHDSDQTAQLPAETRAGILAQVHAREAGTEEKASLEVLIRAAGDKIAAASVAQVLAGLCRSDAKTAKRMIAELAAKDPQAAAGLLKAMVGTDPQQAREILSDLAARTPDGAAEVLHVVSEGTDGGDIVALVVQDLFDQSPVTLIKMAPFLHEKTVKALKSSASSAKGTEKGEKIAQALSLVQLVQGRKYNVDNLVEAITAKAADDPLGAFLLMRSVNEAPSQLSSGKSLDILMNRVTNKVATALLESGKPSRDGSTGPAPADYRVLTAAGLISPTALYNKDSGEIHSQVRESLQIAEGERNVPQDKLQTLTLLTASPDRIISDYAWSELKHAMKTCRPETEEMLTGVLARLDREAPELAANVRACFGELGIVPDRQVHMFSETAAPDLAVSTAGLAYTPGEAIPVAEAAQVDRISQDQQTGNETLAVIYEALRYDGQFAAQVAANFGAVMLKEVVALLDGTQSPVVGGRKLSGSEIAEMRLLLTALADMVARAENEQSGMDKPRLITEMATVISLARLAGQSREIVRKISFSVSEAHIENAQTEAAGITEQVIPHLISCIGSLREGSGAKLPAGLEEQLKDILISLEGLQDITLSRALLNEKMQKTIQKLGMLLEDLASLEGINPAVADSIRRVIINGLLAVMFLQNGKRNYLSKDTMEELSKALADPGDENTGIVADSLKGASAAEVARLMAAPALSNGKGSGS